MSTGIDADKQMFQRLKSIISSPQDAREMDAASVNGAVDFCLDRLRRLRMGGRSSALIAMSVLLWEARKRKTNIALDVEECLSLAFRVALDPSFVQAEWAIVLSGVLIEGYLGNLPPESQAEIIRQCRLMLQHIESSPGTVSVVRDAARFLLSAWDAHFPRGLDPVVRICCAGWSGTSSVAAISGARLKELMDQMSCRLPASMSDRERSLYRLYLERAGDWQLLGNVFLGPNP
jgi:hypothetical protein